MQSTHLFLAFLQSVYDTSINCQSCPKLPDDAYTLVQNDENAEAVVRDMFVRFLSDNDNLSAMHTLSCMSMSKQPLQNPWFPLHIREILVSARSSPPTYARLWRDLIAVCHTVTPSATQFSAQLAEIDKQMGCVANSTQSSIPSPNISMSDVLAQVLQPLQAMMQQDISELNPSVLVSTVGTAIQPLVDSLQDGDYKTGVQQVMQGLATLSKKS